MSIRNLLLDGNYETLAANVLLHSNATMREFNDDTMMIHCDYDGFQFSLRFAYDCAKEREKCALRGLIAQCIIEDCRAPGIFEILAVAPMQFPGSGVRFESKEMQEIAKKYDKHTISAQFFEAYDLTFAQFLTRDCAQSMRASIFQVLFTFLALQRKLPYLAITGFGDMQNYYVIDAREDRERALESRMINRGHIFDADGARWCVPWTGFWIKLGDFEIGKGAPWHEEFLDGLQRTAPLYLRDLKWRGRDLREILNDPFFAEFRTNDSHSRDHVVAFRI